MTSYNLRPRPYTTLPSFAVTEAKEKRKAVLERAAAIRRANYARFIERRRAITNTDVEEDEI
jgi:hypothetical protein